MIKAWQRFFSVFLQDTWQRANHQYLQGRLQEPVFQIDESRKYLGRWYADTRTISISSELLMNRSELEVEEVLRHEMAHQYADEILKARHHGDDKPHGSGFRHACRLLEIDHHARYAPKSEPSPILEKIRKLLALADSENPHEAELAMARARSLMERHELDPESRREGFCFAYLGKPRARKQAEEQMVASILGSFFHVKVIWVPSAMVINQKNTWLLEISGTPTNLEIAAYVYDFLMREVEILWRDHRRRNPTLKGRTPKRDYKVGVLRGFKEKLAADQAEDEASSGRELILMKQAHLQEFFEDRHPSIRRSRKLTYRISNEFQQGFQQGQNLEIRQGIKKGQENPALGPKAIGPGGK